MLCSIGSRSWLYLFLFLFSFSSYSQNFVPQFDLSQDPIKVAVIGTGYVGLVSGAGLAEFGNHVVCADIDSKKIDMLKRGEIPIFEPGLGELVDKNIIAQRLSFTDDVAQAVRDAQIILIAVGTPMQEDGSANLSYVESVVKTIASTITSHKVICTKSTVPVGTGAWIKSLLEQAGIDKKLFDIVSNPEFLREGSAIQDFLKPDRVVIGVESKRASVLMCSLYKKIIEERVPCVLTNIVTAEIIKYASNSFLAAKLSFINEMANFCDAAGAKIKDVTWAMGLDKRISPYFLSPGPGFGGSCFPKDSAALAYTAAQYDVDMKMIKALVAVNKEQVKKPVEKLLRLVDVRKTYKKELTHKTIAVLGLAFKNNTDDIRYSPAITTIELLLEHGATVKAYDPAAMDEMKKVFPNITYCDSSYEALADVDAVVIMTEWDEFRELDIEKMAAVMKGNIVIDMRNLLDVAQLQKHGFIVDTLGVPS